MASYVANAAMRDIEKHNPQLADVLPKTYICHHCHLRAREISDHIFPSFFFPLTHSKHAFTVTMVTSGSLRESRRPALPGGA